MMQLQSFLFFKESIFPWYIKGTLNTLVFITMQSTYHFKINEPLGNEFIMHMTVYAYFSISIFKKKQIDDMINFRNWKSLFFLKEQMSKTLRVI